MTCVTDAAHTDGLPRRQSGAFRRQTRLQSSMTKPVSSGSRCLCPNGSIRLRADAAEEQVAVRRHLTQDDGGPQLRGFTDEEKASIDLLSSDELRPEGFVEKAFGNSRHDRGITLSGIPVGTDIIPPQQGHEQLVRPGIPERKGELRCRIVLGEFIEPPENAVPGIARGGLFTRGRSPICEERLDPLQFFDKALMIVQSSSSTCSRCRRAFSSKWRCASFLRSRATITLSGM